MIKNLNITAILIGIPCPLICFYLLRIKVFLLAVHGTQLAVWIFNTSDEIVHLIITIFWTTIVYSEIILWVQIGSSLFMFLTWESACFRTLDWY